MSVTISSGFKSALNPINSLGKDLTQLLEAGELAIFLMNTPPPTPQEVLFGIQTYRVSDYGGSNKVVDHTRTFLSECMGVFQLKPSDWVDAHEVASHLLGNADQGLARSSFHLIPSEQRGNIELRHTGSVVHRNAPPRGLAAQWALLGRASDSCNTRTYVRPGGEERAILYSEQDRVLDFRGMIPLTIGKVGSPANIWLEDGWWKPLYPWVNLYYGGAKHFIYYILEALKVRKIELKLNTTAGN
ncbi:hypothetical protein [Pseudoalteromonas umbrosa]|uniref:hypothetical protein n=1 Tax=Pseudoalteromonas umbrosa TaxID=3048489 RepID=UPI0024C264A5|nr:hypothetical protein [Pseudoalteromonas sp. B95]MDK1290071.1 hypothetical protein [Pseudoalteromonas sp. B95]